MKGAQNKAIYKLSADIKKNSSDKYKKSDQAFSGVFKVRPYGKFALVFSLLLIFSPWYMILDRDNQR